MRVYYSPAGPHSSRPSHLRCKSKHVPVNAQRCKRPRQKSVQLTRISANIYIPLIAYIYLSIHIYRERLISYARFVVTRVSQFDNTNFKLPNQIYKVGKCIQMRARLIATNACQSIIYVIKQ